VLWSLGVGEAFEGGPYASASETTLHESLTIKSFTFSPFQTNCYVCHDAGEAVLVDPSCYAEGERQAVVDYLEEQGLTLRHLLLTHAHIDHIFGSAFLAERYGMPWQMHRDALPFVEQAQEQASFFGMPLAPPPMPRPEHFFREGDVIRFGTASWEVLETPGHAPGSVCFYDAADGYVLVGDVLFKDSIGRTDLPGGSLPTLMHSIFQRLLPLGDDTRVYPGHGPATTLGRERRHNPFLTGTFPGDV